MAEGCEHSCRKFLSSVSERVNETGFEGEVVEVSGNERELV